MVVFLSHFVSDLALVGVQIRSFNSILILFEYIYRTYIYTILSPNHPFTAYTKLYDIVHKTLTPIIK